MNKNIIELVISLPVKTFTGEDIYTIFLEDLWFDPSTFYGDRITFGFKKYKKKYLEEIKKQKEVVDFYMIDKDSGQGLHAVQPSLSNPCQCIHLLFKITMYDTILQKLEQHFFDKMITMYAAQYYDMYLQSANNITAYEVKKMQPPQDKLLKDEYGDYTIVDISNNPGRAIMVSNMWLTSCWRMWFGKDFYTHVAKEHLKTFSQASLIEELENDVLLIELYKDPMQANLPENRKIQQAFRDHIDMEKLIEKIK